MNRTIKTITLLLFAALMATTALAVDPPGILNHQGVINADGLPFNGTGAFKFALVDAAGTNTFWSNGGISTGGSEPPYAVSLSVPDWTIMDVQMPEMNGFTATREILRQFGGARVIMLTQHDLPEYREEARAAGACAFISKDDLSCLHSILQPCSAAVRAAMLPRKSTTR